jgi:Tfp pilus assembly protein PilX
MPVTQRNSESGFTMITTVIAMSVIVLLSAVAVVAVNSDVHLTRNDLDRKQAYEAARAGVEDYAFHLDANGSYWEKCAGVAAPSAVNLQGSTANTRLVPGSGGAAKYAIELLPSSSQTTYTQCSTANPVGSMIESGGTLPGSFRIRSTGFAGKSKASVVATFKRPSFLDYVYFTQYETSDPIVYAKSTWLAAAYKRCETTIQAGRYTSEIPGSGGRYCNVISFTSGESIKGPLHTNDALVICGNPTFGRDSSDSIEVGASPPGWYDGTSSTLGPERADSNNCPDANPTFKGTFRTNSAILEPPTTNGELAKVAEPSFRYKGQIRICLSGTTMTVGSGSTCTGVYNGSIPSNGVIYVSNGTGCSTVYSPFTAEYPSTSSCGNVYVQGSYTGQLTIAAENDIIIRDDLKKTEPSNGMLGLIANNFIRVYHSYPNEGIDSSTGRPECDHTSGGSESGLGSLTIDAAMLAIKHSFIVDHYDCGSSQGTLTIHGAVAQKFRGPVGTFNSSGTVNGYSKNYEYDNRLRYQEPPNFLDPVTKSWVIGRETLG